MKVVDVLLNGGPKKQKKAITFDTPKVVDYSLDTENILGQPYTLMTRLAGSSLLSLWGGLNICQEADAIRQLILVIQQIASYGAAACGVVGTKHVEPAFRYGVDSDIFIDKFPTPFSDKPQSWSPPEKWVTQTPFPWLATVRTTALGGPIAVRTVRAKA
jgi:hypothetical protein